MFSSELLILILGWVFIFFSLVFCFFLFARAGRHELVDWNIIFDLGFFSVFGGLLFGRIVDFLTNPLFYSWSFKKLIFFNVWQGISFWGVLLGIFLFVWLYLRNKKENFWFVLDLAAAPLALIRALAGLFLIFGKSAKALSVNLSFIKLPTVEIKIGLFYFLYYLALFWTLKRLEKRKRHRGFFICFFLAGAAFFESLMSLTGKTPKLFSFVSYGLLLPALFLIFTSIRWYNLAKRKPASDLKNIFAFLLIGIFSLRTVLFSVNEAGKVSRAILFSPLYLIRSICFGAKTFFLEVADSFADLFHNFKPKR